MKTITLKLICVVIVFFGTSRRDIWAMSPKPSEDESTWVMREDGSKSCDSTGKDALAAGAEALKKMGVAVFEAKKLEDGLMHAQACGMPTGKKNAYRISKKDLKNAEAMGFHQ